MRERLRCRLLDLHKWRNKMKKNIMELHRRVDLNDLRSPSKDEGERQKEKESRD